MKRYVFNILTLLFFLEIFHINVLCRFFCFHNFRALLGRPAPFEDSVPFDKPVYHVNYGGPLNNMGEYFKTEKGKTLFLSRMYFFANQYANNPAIFGWELWNEVNAVNDFYNKSETLLNWSKNMFDRAQEIFPNHLVMQTYCQNLKDQLWLNFKHHKNILL